MNVVHVIAIHLPPEAQRAGGTYDVVADLNVGGQRESFTFHVSPLGMPGQDISIVQSDMKFIDRFRDRLPLTREVRRLVGLAVHHGHVHLPQVVAA